VQEADTRWVPASCSVQEAGHPVLPASRSVQEAGHPVLPACRSVQEAGHPVLPACRSVQEAGHPVLPASCSVQEAGTRWVLAFFRKGINQCANGHSGINSWTFITLKIIRNYPDIKKGGKVLYLRGERNDKLIRTVMENIKINNYPFGPFPVMLIGATVDGKPNFRTAGAVSPMVFTGANYCRPGGIAGKAFKAGKNIQL
jgi:hypothetical protein